MSEETSSYPRSDPDNPRSAADDEETLDLVVIGEMASAIVPVEPAPGRRAVLRGRILSRIRTPSASPTPPPARPGGNVTIRARDGGWIDFAPGIHAKLLFTHGTSETYLARLDPGAVVPPHPHPGIEECLVLEGRIECSDGTYLDSGDYQAHFEGTSHGEIRSPGGALLFLRYSEPLSRYLSL